MHYGDYDWDDERDLADERDSRPATEAEAHVEWHLNAGVPMGTPGCPQDACHGDPNEGEDEELVALTHEFVPDPGPWDEAAARVPEFVPEPASYDTDDLPF